VAQLHFTQTLTAKIAGELGVIIVTKNMDINMYKIIYFTCISLILVGCSGELEDGDLPDIENDVSISQGIYGQVASYPDYTPNNGPSAVQDFEVDVYFYKPNLVEVPQDLPFVSATTNHKGFYEIPLQGGIYCVCAYDNCTQVEISEDDTERLNYSFSNIGSWSIEGADCQEL
uniref:hypothetical protein n=1 Tax=Teredinibacter waterburyi TaxID=1500538 RepID=UPI00165FF92D